MITCRGKALILMVCTVLLLINARAEAQVRGEISRPGSVLVPVSVPGLEWGGGETRPAAAARFNKLLAEDLRRSGIFNVVDPPRGLGLPSSDGYGGWSAAGVLGVVGGSYTGTPGGITVEVRFFDVAAGRSLGGRRLNGSVDAVSAMAHQVADGVMEIVTGREGPFHSWIAFVSDREEHFRELYVYSFDGAVSRLTAHRSITMAPAWNRDATRIAFTSFKSGKPVLYGYDLSSGNDSRLAHRHGVNVGAAWAPQGLSLLFSREVEGNSDLYILDLGSERTRRLTRHWGIDVDPAWSPDGRSVAFCSSRGGTPQVYVMKKDGSDMRRVTFEGSYNCSPAWSPDGRHLAWTGRVGRYFQVLAMPAAGGKPRQLTFEGENEDPSWSPDSRFLVFSSKRAGDRDLYMVHAARGIITRLTSGHGDDAAPTWSGRLR